MIKTVATTPYTDQKMGTGGLRKKTKVMMQPNYFENFIQTVFNTIGGVEGKDITRKIIFENKKTYKTCNSTICTSNCNSNIYSFR